MALAAPAKDASPAAIRTAGVVHDQTGAAIAGAQVSLLSAAGRQVRTTDAEGRFVFDQLSAREGTLEVIALGFARQRRAWRAGETDLEIVLSPAGVAQEITVTAARTSVELGSTSTSVVVLSSDELASVGALTLDDTLRYVPGFSLFRRSGSRTANPTSQGVSLRGLGASGASRAVVLSDGIPLNDPFGGWVYWGRLPRLAMAAVEVASGGASDLYGSDALGGVVNILRRPAAQSGISVETSYGNQNTPDIALFAGGRRGAWAGAISGGAFRTGGYIAVDPAERGAADRPATSERAVGEATLERIFRDRGRAFLRGSVFGEARGNGTAFQQNRTTIRQLDLGGDWKSDQAGAFSVRGFLSRQVFNQTFSAVALDRSDETPTRAQRVPAQQVGFSAQWSRAAGTRQALVGGVEWRRVHGESDELAYTGGMPASFALAGGREHAVGVFLMDTINVTPSFLLTASGRIEHWRNYRGFSGTQSLDQTSTAVAPFPDRRETFFSPRLGALYRMTTHLSLTASAYRSFRAPTLNELYRSFRVGNILTLANEQLRAERLTGGEAGALITGLAQRFMLRGNFFWSDITRPVANVTLDVTPELITRQRQNLGRTRSRGVELNAEARLSSALSVSGGYQFTSATVVRFPANTALQGLLVPQIPRHQFTLLARYSRPSVILLGLQGRFAGDQFDDDRNTLRLARFFTVDALASRPITAGLDLFVAAENILNQRYDIGRTPVRTIAPPVLVRAGMRVQWGAR